MAMNPSALRSALLSGFVAKVKPLFTGIADNHQLTGKEFENFWDKISEVIADEVVGHITSLAKCSGLDSHGDSHDNVGIV